MNEQTIQAPLIDPHRAGMTPNRHDYNSILNTVPLSLYIGYSYEPKDADTINECEQNVLFYEGSERDTPGGNQINQNG